MASSAISPSERSASPIARSITPSPTSEACRVAAEHFIWARTKAGLSLVQIMESIGQPWSYSMGEDDVLIALERAWLMINRPYKKARPIGRKLSPRFAATALALTG